MKKKLIVLNELKKNLKIKMKKKILKMDILGEKTFMFTGKLVGISRAEAKSLVEKNQVKLLAM